MLTVDMRVQWVFERLIADWLVRFRPCVDSNDSTRFACHNCSETLEYAYMEDRLYAIRCPKCKTITLVKNTCPGEAASLVGYEDMLLEAPKEE